MCTKIIGLAKMKAIKQYIIIKYAHELSLRVIESCLTWICSISIASFEIITEHIRSLISIAYILSEYSRDFQSAIQRN